MPLWPEGVPGALAPGGDERPEVRPGDEAFLTNIHVPTLHRHPAPAERRTGAAVIVCPGGGCGGLSMTKEGHDIAGWLNTLGVDGLDELLARADEDWLAGRLVVTPHTAWFSDDAWREMRQKAALAARMYLLTGKLRSPVEA